MAQILTGTSGFSFRDWKGTVYPPNLPPHQQLEWYASRLPFVELNFTFYRMPESNTLSRMRSRVPEGFRFSVKAHGSLTHDRSRDWEREAGRLKDALNPMTESGALICTLFQFPFSFKYTNENRQYLAHLLDACRDTKPAVEFRHPDWIRNSVFEGLAERDVTLVCPDLPPIKDLPHVQPRATSLLGYLRLHGRNVDNWWTGTNETRYHYRYSPGELRSIADTARSIADDVDSLVVAFNNHFTGNAFHNAVELQAILGTPGS